MELLEREQELERVAGALAAAREGSGRLLLLEGVAGIGKTRLLAATEQIAREEGLLVLRTQGSELGSALPWVTARELLAPAVERLPASARRGLLAQAGDEASGLFTPTSARTARDADASLIPRRAHALTWLVSDISERDPTLILLDDAHWADEPSMQFLAHLAGRLSEIRCSLLIARRPRARAAAAGALDRVAAAPETDTVTLRPLTAAAVERLLRASVEGEIANGAVTACMELTGGNPFYVQALLRELREVHGRDERIEAKLVMNATPARVVDSVRVRLEPLGPDALALARAVSVFGPGARLRHASLLAELDADRAAQALDRLVAADLAVQGEPLRLAHPLVAAAVYEDIPTAQRQSWHLRAARILSDDHMELPRVAAHLLAVPGEGDPWVASTLHAAARSAAAEGATELAARFLERSLQEPPAEASRLELLEDLARLEVSLGRREGIARLQAALELADTDGRRGGLVLELGRALMAAGEPAAAAAVLEDGISALQSLDPELHRELAAMHWMAATLVSVQGSPAIELRERDPGAQAEPASRGERQMLAQLAQQRAFEGAHPRELRELCERAWGDGELLAMEGCDGLTWSLVTGSLLLADDLEREVEICDAVIAQARATGSPMAYATACYCRALPHLYLGAVDDALADAQAALAGREDGWITFEGAALATFAFASIEHGALAPAMKVLTPAMADSRLQQSIEYFLLTAAHGSALLADGRPREALEALLTVGRILDQAGVRTSAMVTWRADAAFAAALAGDPQRARQLADDELEATRDCGIPRVEAAALRAVALTQGGDRALELLHEARELLEQTPSRLERVRVLVDLGAALRRRGQRAQAGPYLREALRQAGDGGALALRARAAAELAAARIRGGPTGALPEHDELTPSELRVARLAAAGHSNREIARMLFVTVKAVEYHLSNCYRKLQLERRGQLAGALERRRRPATLD